MATTEFGVTLRRWRDRVTPVAVGMAGGGHRRTAGLRREELAQLAGISVDYVTRLEQGRATHPSAQVVEALGRALRLSRAERTRLYALAGLMALMGEHDGDDRNAVWRTFLGSGSRVEHTPQSLRRLQISHAATLRAAAQRYPADQTVHKLVTELRTRSALFTEMWDSAAPERGEVVSSKVINHPHVGSVTLDCDTLTVTDADLTIMVYTAEPGTEDTDKLALLAVIGSQNTVG